MMKAPLSPWWGEYIYGTPAGPRHVRLIGYTPSYKENCRIITKQALLLLTPFLIEANHKIIGFVEVVSMNSEGLNES
jgi:hypothetical protein